ncbi:MAG: hypothetical protein LUH55_06295 [Bacteroides thetaiotaomicron]|nr:hypothetical protein [Bacteroides thetaiotaomicron]
MSKKTTPPYVPVTIRNKIEQLDELLQSANSLYEEIFDWYDAELKSYDSGSNALDELFSPNGSYVVPAISYNAIMEGLSIVQTFNETYPDRD